MTVASPHSTHSMEYRLTNQDADMQVRLILKKDGTGLRLFYRRGDQEDFGFQSGDIATVRSYEQVRASVSLDTDGAPGPVFSFEVIVPVITVGADVPGQGPFGVFAAGLRIEHFTASGEPSPGPRQAIEAFALTGRAIALPEDDDA
jgi:hypothetical protein